jgi:acetyl-CoA acyltransferase
MDCAIAGGAESMTMVPMTGLKFSPNPYLAAEWPGAYLGMGLTAENVADKYGISRADQDAFAYDSHRNANRAVESGLFDPEIVPIQVDLVEYDKSGGVQKKSFTFKRDEGPRADTTIEALAKLKPAFKEGGSVTAGNSSQMSDGAAAVIIMSRAKAESIGLKPLVRFVAFAVGGVDPEYMGIGPIVAIPKVLKLAGMGLSEISLIELNEAFAAQSLAVIRELGINPEITNVNEMKRRNVQFGMVSMCIGGGMGAAGIFENLN